MKKHTILLILLAVGLCSCNQSTQSTSDSNTSKTLDVTKNSQNEKQLIGFNEIASSFRKHDN